jgi:hypothetical protein
MAGSKRNPRQIFRISFGQPRFLFGRDPINDSRIPVFWSELGLVVHASEIIHASPNPRIVFKLQTALWKGADFK